MRKSMLQGNKLTKALILLMLVLTACSQKTTPTPPPPVYSVASTAIPLSEHTIRIQYSVYEDLNPAQNVVEPGELFTIFDNRNNVANPQMSFKLVWDQGTAAKSDDVIKKYSPTPTQEKFLGTLEELMKAKIVLDDGSVVSVFEDTGVFLLFK